jgi:hypothetical protein
MTQGMAARAKLYAVKYEPSAAIAVPPGDVAA